MEDYGNYINFKVLLALVTLIHEKLRALDNGVSLLALNKTWHPSEDEIAEVRFGYTDQYSFLKTALTQALETLEKMK